MKIFFLFIINIFFQEDINFKFFKEMTLWGLKNDNNQILIKPNFENLSFFPNNKKFIKAKKFDKYGVLTINGKLIIPHKFDEIFLCKEAYFVVENQTSRGFQNGLFLANGKEVIPLANHRVSLINERLVICNRGVLLLSTNHERIEKWLILPKNDFVKYDDLRKIILVFKGKKLFEYSILNNTSIKLLSQKSYGKNYPIEENGQ